MRYDREVGQSRIDELSSVRGWIEPEFVHTDPVTGKQHRLITLEDGEMIAQGYACGECGAKYDMVMPRCVVCREPIALDLAPMRPEWTQHLADRASGASGGKPLDVETFLAEVARDPDVEQRRL